MPGDLTLLEGTTFLLVASRLVQVLFPSESMNYKSNI